MTPATAARCMRDSALDGLVHNQDQARLIANPTVEVDSLVDHLTVLARTSMPEQRRHIRAALDIARRLHESNQLEAACERHIAGAADRAADELELITASGVAPMGRRRVARALRDPLANLCNPVIRGARRQAAMDAVVDVCRRSTRANVLSTTVRHELGVKRFSLLTELVDAMPAEVIA